MKQPSPAHAIVLLLELISILLVAVQCQPQPARGDITNLQPVIWLAAISSNYAAPVLSTCNSEDNNCG